MHLKFTKKTPQTTDLNCIPILIINTSFNHKNVSKLQILIKFLCTFSYLYANLSNNKIKNKYSIFFGLHIIKNLFVSAYIFSATSKSQCCLCTNVCRIFRASCTCMFCLFANISLTVISRKFATRKIEKKPQKTKNLFPLT